MLKKKSKILLFATVMGTVSMLAMPSLAQETMSCASGKVWIPDNNKSVTIKGFCKAVIVAGNHNKITSQGIGELTLMGNQNVISAGKIDKLIQQGEGNKTAYRGAKPNTKSMGRNNIVSRSGDASKGHEHVTKKTVKSSVKHAHKHRPKKTTTATRSKIASPPSQLSKVLFLGNLERPKMLIMYKDGTARYNPKTSVEYLNISSDKAKNPKAWRHWRRRGGKLQLRKFGSAEWSTVKNLKAPAVKPARSGLKLSGRWKHARSSMSMNGGSAFFANYVFTPQGRYESSSSSIMGASTPGISSSIASGSCDKTGRRGASSSTSAGGGVASSSSRRKGCGNANVGQYKIKGYTIEFHAEDGNVYRKPFYYIKNDLVFVGNRWFSAGLN